MTGLREDVSGWRSPSGGGDIVITPEPVENYELYLEWRVSENGNSGIIYNVKEDPDLEHAYLSRPEYQSLDNGGYPDGQTETQRAADLDHLFPSRTVIHNPP